MKAKVQMAARILLGLIFFVFGLNGFLNFIPPPPEMPEAVMNFMGAIMATGYFMPVVKGTEVICGALLLANYCSPLALVVLAPVTLQIFLFHFFLTPGVSNIVMPVIMIALHITAAMAYWPIYRPMFGRQRT